MMMAAEMITICTTSMRKTATAPTAGPKRRCQKVSDGVLWRFPNMKRDSSHDITTLRPFQGADAAKKKEGRTPLSWRDSRSGGGLGLPKHPLRGPIDEVDAFLRDAVLDGGREHSGLRVTVRQRFEHHLGLVRKRLAIHGTAPGVLGVMLGIERLEGLAERRERVWERKGQLLHVFLLGGLHGRR